MSETVDKEKSKKSEEILNKIFDLCNKIEEEKNSSKRIVYAIKTKMLITKMERIIKLENLKEEHNKEKEKIKKGIKKSKSDCRTDIAKLTKEIKQLKRKLKENKEYDYLSKSFIFPKKDVQQQGGIDEYVDLLGDSDNEEQREAAEKINQTGSIRENIDKKEQQLEEKKNELLSIEKSAKRKVRTMDINETSLMIKEKVNIFAKIKNLFTSIVVVAKETYNENKKSKEVLNNKNEYLNKGEDLYKKQLQEIKREYDEKMQKLNEKYNEFTQKMDEKHGERLDKQKQTQRTQQANNFREQVTQYAKTKDIDNDGNERKVEEPEEEVQQPKEKIEEDEERVEKPNDEIEEVYGEEISKEEYRRVYEDNVNKEKEKRTQEEIIDLEI